MTRWSQATSAWKRQTVQRSMVAGSSVWARASAERGLVGFTGVCCPAGQDWGGVAGVAAQRGGDVAVAAGAEDADGAVAGDTETVEAAQVRQLCALTRSESPPALVSAVVCLDVVVVILPVRQLARRLPSRL